MKRLATYHAVTVPLLVAGCAAPRTDIALDHTHLTPHPPDAIAARIAEDPQRFLRETLQRCEALPSYEVDFYKQERLGLLAKQLRPEEHMRVKFRARPFSVKMTMLNEDHDFVETAYVEGQNQGKLRCRWRKALWPGAKPPVNDYDPAFAVQFGRTINPITDFGVARLMQKIVGTLDRAIDMALPPTIEFLGAGTLEKGDTPIYHIRLQYAQETRFARPKVDLLIHKDSLLPAASYTWLSNGELEGKYVYTDFDLGATFTDEDFQIEER